METTYKVVVPFHWYDGGWLMGRSPYISKIVKDLTEARILAVKCDKIDSFKYLSRSLYDSEVKYIELVLNEFGLYHDGCIIGKAEIYKITTERIKTI